MGRTFLLASLDIDLVVSRSIMRYPLHTRGQGVHNLPVEDTDTVRREVVSVYPDNALVLPACFEVCQEVGSIGRIHDLESEHMRIDIVKGIEKISSPLHRRLPGTYPCILDEPIQGLLRLEVSTIGSNDIRINVTLTADHNPRHLDSPRELELKNRNAR